MIEWFRVWCKGIVIAVIVATLLELILPENSSKKYIKIIIGIFITYTIISPVISKFTGFEINEMIEMDDYIETSSSLISEQDLSKKTNDSIKSVYAQSPGDH